jgi:murein L,D-transpeptidase YafK
LKPGRHLWMAGIACGILLLATGTAAHGQLSRELGLLPGDGPVAASATVPLPTASAFALEQLRHSRVLEARVATRHTIKRLFHERGISYPAAEIFLRIFKRERSLELWVRPVAGERFELLKTYGICAMAGELGQNRKQGDNQTPEGFYAISYFNPRSDFHLSLHIDYPNRRDRAAGADGVKLGGDIFIHGGCLSEGCLAITDEGIRELYWLAVEARSVGQRRIPVHIFPARLGEADLELLQSAFSGRPELGRFWATLKAGYDYFEEHRRIPAIAVSGDAEYVVMGAATDISGPMGEPVVTPLSVPASVEPRAVNPVRAPLGTPVGGGS